MKNKITLLLLTLITQSVIASVNIDSLFALSQDASLPDSVKVKALNSIAFDGFLYSDPDSTFKIAQQAFELAKSINYQNGMASALKNQGDSYLIRGEYDQSIPYYKKAILLFEKLDDLKGEAAVLNNLGSVYRLQRKYAEAIDLFSRSLTINRKIKNEKTVGSTLFNMGSIYHIMEEEENALEYYEASLKINEKEDGNKRNLALALLNLGDIARDKNALEKSKKYLDKAIVAAKEFGDASVVGDVLISYGLTYSSEKDFEKALDLFNEALVLSKENENEQIISYAIINIGNIFYKQGKYELAIVKFKEALKFDNRLVDSSTNAESLYNCYKKLDQPKNALHYFELHKMYSDSLLNTTTIEQVAEAKTKYESEKKELENESLKINNALVVAQRQQYKLGSIVLLSLLSLMAYFFYQLRKTKRQVDSQNIQLQQLNTTKDKFFGIIAHDIRSPIVALDGVGEQMNYYLKKDDKGKLERLADRVDSTAKRLSGLLDNLLNWALLQQGVIPYHPKSLNVKTIVDHTLQMFSNNAEAKNIGLKTDVEESINVFADESAISTILRNLISNAIKFTPENGTVSISVEPKADKVFININDTGTGLSTEKLNQLFTLEKKSEKGTAGEKGTGLGLTLVKELVDLNKGIVDVVSQLNHGTTFTIGLPAKS